MIFKRQKESEESTKAWILFAATCFLLLKIFLFFQYEIGPAFSRLVSFIRASHGIQDKIYSLLYFDIAVLIGFALLLVCLVSYFVGKPGKPGSVLFKLHGKPILTFFILTPIVGMFLVTVPSLLGNLFLDFHEPTRILENFANAHPLYKSTVSRIALCFGLSFALCAATKKQTGWRSALFLILPPFHLYPLLWYSGLAGLFPSRYWAIWRPLLLGMTCLMPFLIFPFAQPIREGIPVREKGAEMVLENCDGYQAERNPKSPEVFVRCNKNPQILHLEKRNASSGWTILNKSKVTDFYWNRGSFDFEKDILTILSLRKRALEQYRLSYLIQTKSVPLDFGDPAVRSMNLLIAQDFSRNLLAVCDQGKLMIIDLATFELVRSIDLGPDWVVWDMEYDPAYDRLLLLDKEHLCAFDITTLDEISKIKLPGIAFDLLIDPKTKNILVSFPTQMEVGVYDPHRFERIDTISGPMGVRTLAIDDTRRLLFLSSISGVIEMRNIDTKKWIGRVRLSPWIHWISPIPEYGEAVVTMGDVDTVIWKYDPINDHFSIFDSMLFLAEKTYRFLFLKGK